MALKIIGAGMGRTGTYSLKLALDEIGFAPCYHMADVFEHPAQAEYWAAIGEGAAPDWDRMFEGYSAAVDFPVAGYWREIAAHYPESKVILTSRDSQSWFKSTQDTIFSPLNSMAELEGNIGIVLRGLAARHFPRGPNDRDGCIAAFEAHNRAVREAGLGSRLLDYRVSEGWGPLCRFLGVAAPATEFPHANTTAEFRAHFEEK
jgi:hypothetical protein